MWHCQTEGCIPKLCNIFTLQQLISIFQVIEPLASLKDDYEYARPFKPLFGLRLLMQRLKIAALVPWHPLIKLSRSLSILPFLLLYRPLR